MINSLFSISSKKKPRRVLSQKELEEFEKKWRVIHDGFSKLQSCLQSANNKSPFSQEEYANLYNTILSIARKEVDRSHKVTVGKQSVHPEIPLETEMLYSRYREYISQYLEKNVIPSLKSKEADTLLVDIVKHWVNHQVLMKWVGKVFNYLDRYYTRLNSKKPLRDVALMCFQDQVYNPFKSDVTAAILRKIELERNKEQVDKSIIKNTVNLFVEMGINSLTVYKEDFEYQMISQTEMYYKTKAAEWISSLTSSEYLKVAEENLLSEKQRAENYLHPSSVELIVKAVEKQLIDENKYKILNAEVDGFRDLLNKHKVEEMARMYRMMKRVDCLKDMADCMKDHINRDGKRIIDEHKLQDKIDSISIVGSLLDLHSKYKHVVDHDFEETEVFKIAMKDSYQAFINTDFETTKGEKSSIAEVLASYCDHMMRFTEDETYDKTKDKVENILLIFGYIADKDMFQEFYRRALSKRILTPQAHTNYEIEEMFISKLKTDYGKKYTSKIEGMIKDKTISKELQKGFNEYVTDTEKDLGTVEFQITVLTKSYWPNFVIDLPLTPPEMTACIDAFRDFYKGMHEKKKLEWVFSQGQCQVLARFSSGKKDLHTSTTQCLVLLQFNQSDRMTLQEIHKLVMLPVDQLKRDLLACTVTSKCNVLKKSGDPKSITATDEFYVNEDFTSKHHKVKIPQLTYTSTTSAPNEKEKLKEEVMKDRKTIVEATIVRIMKYRKSLDYQQLVSECTKQVSSVFTPDLKFIKQQIDLLIDRDFLARDTKKSSLITYVA